MYAVLNERWLTEYSPDTNVCTIQDVDLDTKLCYSGAIDRTMAALIFPNLLSSGEPTRDEEARIEIDIPEDNSSAQLVATKILKNGLELRPTKARLERDSSHSPKSHILRLVSYTNEVEARLNQSNHELAMTQKVLSNVTSDQQDFEDIVLKRVSEILYDRNDRIEKQQAIKSESKSESMPQ